MQEEVDDLIGDEATEAADQEQVQAAIAAANDKARNDDINPEELERYIKERFEQPREFAAGSDFNEQTGAAVLLRKPPSEASRYL